MTFSTPPCDICGKASVSVMTVNHEYGAPTIESRCTSHLPPDPKDQRIAELETALDSTRAREAALRDSNRNSLDAFRLFTQLVSDCSSDPAVVASANKIGKEVDTKLARLLLSAAAAPAEAGREEGGAEG